MSIGHIGVCPECRPCPQTQAGRPSPKAGPGRRPRGTRGKFSACHAAGVEARPTRGIHAKACMLFGEGPNPLFYISSGRLGGDDVLFSSRLGGTSFFASPP